MHPSRFSGPIGVFGGSGHNAYLGYNLLTRPELVESVGFFLLRHTGNDKDFLPSGLLAFQKLFGIARERGDDSAKRIARRASMPVRAGSRHARSHRIR